ncbi:hypothetical protein B0H13DRAFT_2319545 [Mycena leptocephala]|nr:hypothetical protein B0H13DRAFT_2319545 [Mycena leptocephala]
MHKSRGFVEFSLPVVEMFPPIPTTRNPPCVGEPPDSVSAVSAAKQGSSRGLGQSPNKLWTCRRDGCERSEASSPTNVPALLSTTTPPPLPTNEPPMAPTKDGKRRLQTGPEGLKLDRELPTEAVVADGVAQPDTLSLAGADTPRAPNHKVAEPSNPFHFYSPPPPVPPSTPRKAVKTGEGPFCPPDRDEKPRDSPAVRKGHRVRTDLDVTTRAAIDFEDDEPITPIRYAHTPDHESSHTPAPDAAPSSPTPSADTIAEPPLDNDDGYDSNEEDMEIDNDDNTMNNAHPAQTAVPAAQQQPQPAAAVAPAAALGLGGAALVAAVAGPTVVLPTKAALLAFVPIGPPNDHQGFQPAQPAPTNLQNGRAPYAQARGQVPNAVTTCTRIFANVTGEQEGMVRDDADEYLALVMFLGGQRFFAVYQNVLDDIHKATASIASPAEMELYRANPAVVQMGDGSKKYQDPFVVFARFPDPAIRTKMHNQRTFAISHDLAFCTETIDPARRSHMIGVWAPVKSSRTPAELQASARTALTLHILTTPTAVRDIAQMTQGNSNLSEDDRVLNVTKTITTQWFPHPESPLICIYMPPINNNIDDNEAFKRTLRTRCYKGEPVECVMCHTDTHLVYLCPTSQGTTGSAAPPPANGGGNAPASTEWWGPPDQMSKLTEGILSKNPSGGRGDDTPASGSGNRGGNRGGNRNGSGRNNTGGPGRNNGGRRN